MKNVHRVRPATVEDLAEHQDGVASVAQALATGLTPRQIARRRAQGRYRPCRRRVIRLAGTPTTWRQTLRVATLAAGDRVAVSHGSAVRLWGLQMPRSVHPRWRRDDAYLELSAPEPRHVRLSGVRGHRSGVWEEGDLRRCEGMVVTSPLRTLIDLSSRLGVDGTGQLLDDMLDRRLVTVAALRERLRRLRPAPGRSVRVLRIVVASRDDACRPIESTPESRIRAVIRRMGLRAPFGHHPAAQRVLGPLRRRRPGGQALPRGRPVGRSSGVDGRRPRRRKRDGPVEPGWVDVHVTATMSVAHVERLLSRIGDHTTGVWCLAG